MVRSDNVYDNYVLIHMKKSREIEKKKEKFLREMKRWLIFILLGGFFVLFNPHRDSWKFPMGVTAEWAERGRFLGWMIMTGGYPL